MMELAHDPGAVAEFEHATWSRCAGRYMDGFGQLVCEAIGPLLDAAGVEEDARVLDLGTGPGVVADAVRARGGRPVGLDFSETMLSEARRRYPQIDFRQGDAESRTGGRLAFTVWADMTKLAAFGLFFAAVEEHAGTADLPHGPLFGVSEFEAYHHLVRNAGFRDSHVQEIDIAWQTPSINTLLAAFSDWAALETFPDDVRVRIEETVRDNARSFQRNGSFVMPNPAILVSAVK